MGKLNLEVVTPAGTIAQVEADIVVAPGTEGAQLYGDAGDDHLEGSSADG